jgi:hypothetical protein
VKWRNRYGAKILAGRKSGRKGDRGTFPKSANYKMGCTMSLQQSASADVARAAYEIAWQEFINLTGLSADERRTGPNQLRWYIRLMTAVGERDPSKIARSALSMTRQYKQIKRSEARVALNTPPAAR